MKRTSTPVWSAEARELAARTQTAKVHASVEGGAKYGFEVEPIKADDRYEFGDTLLIARHTPEHMSYAAAEKAHPDSPWGVFGGDSLFVSSADRPDLLGRDADKLAAQLYDTFFNVFGQTEPDVIIFPTHGHGSPCGADIGSRLESTIGYEKRFNPYFKRTDKNGLWNWGSPPRHRKESRRPQSVVPISIFTMAYCQILGQTADRGKTRKDAEHARQKHH